MNVVAPSARRAALVLLLGVGCTPPPPPEPPPGPLPAAELDHPSGAVAWRALDALGTATFQFPPTNAPGGVSFDGTFHLDKPWEDQKKPYGRMQDWATPLPFPCDMPRPNYAPLGAKMMKGSVEIPFVGGTVPVSGNAWFIEQGEIHMLSIEDPATWSTPLELRVPEIAAALRARNYAEAGLPPERFAQNEATVGPVTRPALYVPAPGEISFPVTVPAGASLDVGAALLADPLLGDRAGDGAVAHVKVGDEDVWSAALSPGGSFEDTRVDLSRWAGQAVTLRFVTEPGATNDYDYVAFSAPTLVVAPARAPRHVVVVGIDTLRWDALGVNGRDRNVTPEIDRWAHGAVLFDNARSPAPRTRPSFRTAFTGLYPLEAVHAPTLAEVLRGQGFRTAGFAANVHLVPRFGFSTGFEHWYYENGARGVDEVDRAIAWMDEHQHEDTYVFIHIMDPHTWYNAPGTYGDMWTEGRKSSHVPEVFDRWQIVQLARRNQLDDNDKALIRGRYDGEVSYVSHALEGLFRKADTWDGRTMTILHSDHGEEFWDHGGYEHNHSVYDELVHVLFAIRPPGGWGGGPHRVSAPVGLIDLVPTVLDTLGIPAEARPRTDGTSLRAFVDAAAAPEAAALGESLAARPMFQGHLMFERERWSTTFQGWKYILQTVRGTEELYDLTQDPKETVNRMKDASAERIATMREALGKATGWPVRPGWRIDIKTPSRSPLALHFEAPVEGAGILDPEADRTVRANLEWGEHPQLTTEQVGEVTLSEDHQDVVFYPTRLAGGQTLYVSCPAECPAGTVVAASGETVPLVAGPIAVGAWALNGNPGTVIVVGRSEADALLAAPTDASQLEALKVLGYIDPD